MKKKLIICIDFDGTITKHEDYPNIGELHINAKNIINSLYNEGHYIIIWTCRCLDKDIKQLKKYLLDSKIKYHKINENSDLITIHPYPKVYADIYIDDRSLFCDKIDWVYIYKLIKEKEKKLKRTIS